jgi:hypothetical protein
MIKWCGLFMLCLTLLAGNAFAGNVLVNPGFETSALPPWFNSNDFCGGCTWNVTSADANSGTYSAFVSGNRLLEQDFTPVPFSSIVDVSLWLKMPDTGIAAVYFLYSDATNGQNIVSVGSTWTKFDMTSFLDPTKSLAGFGVYGCTGCPGLSQTFADDFNVNAVPEPGSLVLMGSGLLGLAGMIRRRLF